MKILTINYQKAFVIGPYLQEKLGIEIELQGADPEFAFAEAKRIVEEWHIQQNPHLYDETIKTVTQEENNAFAEIDAEFEKAKTIVEGYDNQEDAMKWMNNNGWTFNIDLKKIANSKPKKQAEQ